MPIMTRAPGRKRFSPRRRLLLAFIVLLLAALAYLHFTGAAGTSGISSQDMDWNGDGQVSQEEILQSLYSLVVEKSREGRRECRAYAWRGDGKPIRVDCRTTMDDSAQARPE